MKRILFVDDERPVIEALRARMHPLRDRWDMQFVDSGAAALECCEQRPFDVIVADIRMPAMDGVQLLRSVSERWPDTVRIVLSGYAEQEKTLRMVSLAHQFLAKPCPAGQLEAVLERCMALHDLLETSTVRSLVGRIKHLPSLPQTSLKLQHALQTDVSARQVSDIIVRDTALAAKVLQMVNSGFFRLARRITKVEQAVTYLGFTAVRNVVLSAEVFAGWSKLIEQPILRMEALQSHSHAIAATVRRLTENTPIADDCVLAALLHDIGYWILAQECPVLLERALTRARERGIPMSHAEREILGASHAEIGAYLLGIWGLPYSVVEAVAHHHRPTEVVQPGFDTLSALAIACAVAPSSDADAFARRPPPEEEVGPEYLARIGAPFSWDEAKALATEV